MSKVDESMVRDLGRALAIVQRQTEHASEGVRALTQSTYKRVDEHASAIQKLTIVSERESVCVGEGGHRDAAQLFKG